MVALLPCVALGTVAEPLVDEGASFVDPSDEVASEGFGVSIPSLERFFDPNQ
jgi:hypothetical protein